MAQDTLLILDQDGALALHPDGDGLVLFDPDTGAGAECCCGGAAECCFPGWYGCNNLLPHLGDTIAANRAEFTGTASFRYRDWSKDLGGGGGSPTERIDTGEVSLSLYWQGYDPGGGAGCLVESGELGAQSLRGKQTLNGATLFDRTETFRRKVPASLHWGHAYPEVASYRIAEWYLWPDVFGAKEGTASWLLLGEVPHSGVSYRNWAHLWQQLRQRPDLGWPNSLLKECSGNYSRTLAGTVYSMVYSGAVTAGGGNFGGTYRQTSANSAIEMDISLSWSVTLSCGGRSDAWPGCAAFLAAWLAGDAVADVNRDGFVSGDDYDLVLAAHPECFGQISSLYQSRVNSLRNVRRRAVPGALNARGLLGLS